MCLVYEFKMLFNYFVLCEQLAMAHAYPYKRSPLAKVVRVDPGRSRSVVICQ